jgi:CRISPR-associated protein Cas2
MKQQILLVYDIENDRARTKVADACLDYGLDRIQFSAFAGILSTNHQQELMLKIRAILMDREGKSNVKLLPISERDWQARLEIDL